MSNKPATTTTQTQNAPLSGPQGSLYRNIWGDTSNTLKTDLSTPIPQDWTAGATPLQWEGSNMMAGAAPFLGANAGSTSDLSQRISSGYYTNPLNDPNFGGAVKAALDPINQNFFGTVLPGVHDTALRASGGGTGPAAYGGTGGGSPQDVFTQQALQSLGQTEANTVGNMAESSRNAGMGLFGLVPGLNQSAIASALAPSLATEQAGQLQQGFGQNALTNLIQRYMANTGLPLSFENQAAGIGAQGGFGNKNQVSVGPPPSMATQWLQGGLGGVSALNSLFGAGAGGAPSVASNLFGGLTSGVQSLGSALGEIAPETMTMLAPLFMVA